jgi:hypothetical protein
MTDFVSKDMAFGFFDFAGAVYILKRLWLLT